MRKLILIAICILSIRSVAAESLRCNTQLVSVGAVKAELLEKCGTPQFVDHYCKKSYVVSRHEITPYCNEVELWTYNFGVGTFLMNVEFQEGRISDISHGGRAN
jgi:hypothetical protein